MEKSIHIYLDFGKSWKNIEAFIFSSIAVGEQSMSVKPKNKSFGKR